MGTHARRVERLFAAFRAVLDRDWDPIGIRGRVEGEYDSYARSLARWLVDTEKRESHAIAERLRQFRTGAMSLAPNDAADARSRARSSSAQIASTRADEVEVESEFDITRPSDAAVDHGRRAAEIIHRRGRRRRAQRPRGA